MLFDAIYVTIINIKFDTNTYQGKSKGESVVAAILPPRMEVSYCTSGFLCS